MFDVLLFSFSIYIVAVIAQQREVKMTTKRKGRHGVREKKEERENGKKRSRMKSGRERRMRKENRGPKTSGSKRPRQKIMDQE